MKIKLERFKTENKCIFRYFILLILVFITSLVITQLILYKDINNLSTQISNLSTKFRPKSDPWQECISIFLNNIKVSFFAIIIGVIPFLSLSIPIGNGYVLGLVLTKINLMNKNPFIFLIIGYIPHGIFEMTALFYAASIGIFITLNLWSIRSITKKLIFFKKIIPKILFAYLSIIIPLLLIGSFIEVFLSSNMAYHYLLGM